ncbi:MAG: hypothetical protein Q8T11_07905 [Elusimicrobiota bacterium]|nr:hypothetical protein [Elusimicrobiota bacterium]
MRRKPSNRPRSALVRLTAGLALAVLSILPAGAQIIWTPPDVTAEMLTKAGYERVPPDEVAVADLTGFAERLDELRRNDGIRREDIALIRVVIRGQWFLSAETTAKEKAASLGANFLVLEASLGGEEYVGSSRMYRAVRLQRYNGLAVFTRSREAVEGPRASRSESVAPAGPAFGPLKKAAPAEAPSAEEELAWLWHDRQFILSHRLGVDLSSIADPAWRDLEHTVRARFPKAEHEKLVACYQSGAEITLDLKKKTLWPSC